MRMITTLTISALAAAVMAGPVEAAANSYLTLGPVTGAEAAAGKGRENKVEVVSFAFVARKGWDGTIKGGSKAVERSADPDADAADSAASIVSPRDTTSGLATGKRQHRPVGFATPLDRGSVTVMGSFPDCRVGAAHATAELGDARAKYTLSEVTVTKCAADGISLDYAKVRVRAWNPEKKED